ncbi:MAG: S46 family peptidase [Bacteroidota bacterium]
MRTSSYAALGLLIACLFVPTPAVAQDTAEAIDLSAVDVGRFDFGKMWTFDNPPLDYFEEAYGFRPDEAWFAKARQGALRIPGCSASFVSAHGLVMTNHHCVRQFVTDVTYSGERLLDDGFFAESIADERAPTGQDLYADQLIEIEDITARIEAATAEVQGADRKAEARQRQAERIEGLLTTEAKVADTTRFVEVIELYNGGQYSAYTFKRYHDVRMVFVPELDLGKFGGDPDNFTYPRYSLDVAFLRVYDEAGQPLVPEQHFTWSTTGAQEGEAVFVVGNPGSTSRLNTVTQLAFEREFSLPQQLAVLRDRAATLDAYINEHPELADQADLRTTYFSMMNAIKAYSGQLRGLQDRDLILRKAASEQTLFEALQASDSLQARYGSVFQDIADLQRAKQATASQSGALTLFGTPFGSSILTRSVYGYLYDMLRVRSAPPSQLQDIRRSGMEVKTMPKEVEVAFIASRLRELRQYLGADDPTVRRVLGGETPDNVAAQLVAATALVDSTGLDSLLQAGYLRSDDPTVVMAEALTPLYFTLGQQLNNFETREGALNATLAQARFALYGTTIPPDATFSLRIADGRVAGYSYNGTDAPAFTTFFGLYDHYHSYEPSTDWDLPEMWLAPPSTFDLSTPLNLVSTNDITGGNSGSPLLNQDLEVVGLVFDGNIESLPNEYLYTDTIARSVAVDARGILAALDHIYQADRLVLELTGQGFVETEAEADAD